MPTDLVETLRLTRHPQARVRPLAFGSFTFGQFVRIRVTFKVC